MAERPSECGYLVLEMNTGLMDGWYGRLRDAQASLACRREEPGSRWILVQMVDAGPVGMSAITHYPGAEQRRALRVG